MKNIIPTIGIDLAEIDRFKHWHRYTNQRLSKLFSEREIAFCQSVPIKSAERFAARFAAKEAFFKALSPYVKKTPALFTIFKALEVTSNASGVQLYVAWDIIHQYYQIPISGIWPILSISHTKTTACAVIVTYSFP